MIPAPRTTIKPGLYQAFGLVVSSTWRTPELPPATAPGPADVSIELGEVPETLPGATVKNAFFDVAGQDLLIRFGNIARYWLRGGREIIVAPADGAVEDDVRAFLFTVVFGALLHQRDELVLHGSAVEIAGRAVAFMGYSGLGKSTLAAGFRKRGCPVLTDDLCVVRPGGTQWLLAPSFPHMKLWLDALEHLDLSAEGLRRVAHRGEKRAVPLLESFAASALPLAHCYVLRREEKQGDVAVRPLAGPAKVAALRNQTYRPGILAGLDKKERHFQQALELAQGVPISLLLRPAQGFHLDAMIECVLADLAGGRR